MGANAWWLFILKTKAQMLQRYQDAHVLDLWEPYRDRGRSLGFWRRTRRVFCARGDGSEFDRSISARLQEGYDP
jgi:hypothetical protein